MSRRPGAVRQDRPHGARRSRCGPHRPARTSRAAHHPEPPRSAERDVDRPRDRPARRPRRGGSRQRLSRGGPHRRRGSVLLGSRPEGLRHHPEHRRPAGGADRPAVDAVLLPPRPTHAEDAAADHRGHRRPRVRRWDVPVAGRGDPHRVRPCALQRDRHRERPDLHRDGDQLPAAPAGGRRPQQRPAADGAEDRRGRGVPHGPRVPRGARRRAGRRRGGDRRGHDEVQSLRPPVHEGSGVGGARDRLAGRRDRVRGPQPADAGLHGQPPRGDPRLRRRPPARLHRRAPAPQRGRRPVRPGPSVFVAWARP